SRDKLSSAYSFLRPPRAGYRICRAWLGRVTGLSLPGQFALDERQQRIQRLEVRGMPADDVLRASMKRSVRPQRFAGELHDKGVTGGEPTPFRSVRFQLMPSRGR